MCAGVQQPVEVFTDAALSKAVYPALESLQIRLGHHTETALSIHLSGPHRDSAVWTGARRTRTARARRCKGRGILL